MNPDLPRCEATGKVRFTSKRAVRAKSAQYGTRIRPYQCKHCRGWHATKEAYGK